MAGPHAVSSVRRLTGTILGGTGRRAVMTLVGGTTVAQVIAVAVSPVVTRLYSPADVGTFSIVVSIMTLLTAISCLSYNYAIALPEEDETAANILGLCVAVSVGFSILAGVAWLVLGGMLLEGLHATDLGPYVPYMLIGQTLATAAAALSFWVVRMRLFKVLALNSMLAAAVVATTQVLLGLAGGGAVGMLAGTIAGFATTAVFLLIVAWRAHRPSIQAITARGMRRAASRYRRFAFLTTPSVTLNTLGLRLPLITTVALYGTAAGGQFALADRVVALPVSLVAGAVGQVYYSRASEVARSDPAALRALFRGTTKALAGLAVIPAIVLGILAPTAFAILFGPEWRQAGEFVTIMVPWFYLVLIANPTGSTLDVLERQDLHLARELIRLAFFGLAALAAWTLALDVQGSVIALSLAGCGTYAVYALISWTAILLHRSGDHTVDSSSPMAMESQAQQALDPLDT